MSRCTQLAAASLACLFATHARADEFPPANAYARQSFMLLSGMSVAFPVAPASGMTGFDTQFAGPIGTFASMSASFRAVTRGLVLGADLGVSFASGIQPSAVLTPGFAAGWTTPLTPRLAISGAMHIIFLLPTASGAMPDIQVTGEVSLECFLGRHGFIEPVLAIGDFHETGAGNSGQSLFLVAMGYRLGVVF